MKPIRGLYLSLLLACAAQAASAQNPAASPTPAVAPQSGGQLRGTVVDAASGRPVAAASVAVWSRADSVLAGGGVTRNDGTFRVEGLRPGTYYLRVSHLGHATAATADLTLAPGAAPAQVPVIRLAAAAVQLEGITATAERGEVRMSADRNVYSAKDMPGAAGGSSTDVLRSVPAVEVDQDGRVSLRGNQNVAVQINGRAAPMRGDQLGQFLQQLPAAMVDRVEVIPNPSAKYDPEGMAGIVNIVLKANTELGLSGGLALSAGTSERYNGSGNLGYQRGRVTLFGSYGYFRDGRRMNGFNNRTELSGGAATGFLDQFSSTRGSFESHTLSTSAEVKLPGASSITSTLLLSDRELGQRTRGEVTRFDSARNPFFTAENVQHLSSHGATVDGTLSFRRVVKPRENEIAVEARYNHAPSQQRNGFITAPLVPLPGNEPSRVRNLNDLVNGEMYLQADVTRMLRGVRVETGYKAQLRQVENDLSTERFSEPGGAWENAGGGTLFRIEETVHAGYAVFTRNTGSFELQGGMRLERTARSTNRADDLEPFSDYFPSALVAYNIDAARQVKASYSRRIQRPQTQLLNSFLFYEDALNRFRGNPYLRPEYTDAYELGFQRSGELGSVQLTPFYRHTTGAIRRTQTSSGDTITGTVENIATANSFGVDANASLRARRLTGSAGLNVFHQETDGATSAGAVSSAGLGWAARANATLKVSARADVQLFGSYRAAMNSEFGRIGAFMMTNLSLRQKFMNDKASLTLRVQDPFNTMRASSVAEVLDAGLTDSPGPATGYRLHSERRFGARGVFLAFNYNFGQAPRLRARPQEPQGDPGQVASPG